MTRIADHCRDPVGLRGHVGPVSRADDREPQRGCCGMTGTQSRAAGHTAKRLRRRSTVDGGVGGNASTRVTTGQATARGGDARRIEPQVGE